MKVEGGDLHFEGGDLRRTLAFLELLVGAKKLGIDVSNT